MVIQFPLERVTGRNSAVSGHLAAAAYARGRAALMASYGDEIGASLFSMQAMQHMACVPPAASVVPLIRKAIT
jgi:hypothetical protein